jgi:hypothetical protein
VQLSNKSFMFRVFYAWRNQNVIDRLHRRGMLIRAFKNLKVSTARKKYRKTFELAIEKQAKGWKMLNLQSCFNALRIHVELSKAFKMFGFLDGEVEPDMKNHQRQIKLLAKRMREQKMRRAIYTMLIIPYQKKTCMAFERWKQVTQYKRFLMKHTARMLMIRVSKAKLKVAIDRWAVIKQSLVINGEK